MPIVIPARVPRTPLLNAANALGAVGVARFEAEGELQRRDLAERSQLLDEAQFQLGAMQFQQQRQDQQQARQDQIKQQQQAAQERRDLQLERHNQRIDEEFVRQTGMTKAGAEKFAQEHDMPIREVLNLRRMQQAGFEWGYSQQQRDEIETLMNAAQKVSTDPTWNAAAGPGVAGQTMRDNALLQIQQKLSAIQPGYTQTGRSDSFPAGQGIGQQWKDQDAAGGYAPIYTRNSKGEQKVLIKPEDSAAAIQADFKIKEEAAQAKRKAELSKQFRDELRLIKLERGTQSLPATDEEIQVAQTNMTRSQQAVEQIISGTFEPDSPSQPGATPGLPPGLRQTADASGLAALTRTNQGRAQLRQQGTRFDDYLREAANEFPNGSTAQQRDLAIEWWLEDHPTGGTAAASPAASASAGQPSTAAPANPTTVAAPPVGPPPGPAVGAVPGAAVSPPTPATTTTTTTTMPAAQPASPGSIAPSSPTTPSVSASAQPAGPVTRISRGPALTADLAPAVRQGLKRRAALQGGVLTEDDLLAYQSLALLELGIAQNTDAIPNHLIDQLKQIMRRLADEDGFER